MPCAACSGTRVGGGERTRGGPMTASTPVFSMVVPVLNEEEVLPRNLRHPEGRSGRPRPALRGRRRGQRQHGSDAGDHGRALRRRPTLEVPPPQPQLRLSELDHGRDAGGPRRRDHGHRRRPAGPAGADPDFVAKWREGYDVVYGVREKRTGDRRSASSRPCWPCASSPG